MPEQTDHDTGNIDGSNTVGFDRVLLEGFFLHFFANVNLTQDAMDVLTPEGFSLVRNRILGLTTFAPGITVGELIRALRVPHQNVNAPLRTLIADGFIIAEIGIEDRRQRNLYASQKGRVTFLRVLDNQLSRVRRAFDAAGPEAVRGFLEVHRRMVEPSDHAVMKRVLETARRNEDVISQTKAACLKWKTGAA